jgi:hypothetical protein
MLARTLATVKGGAADFATVPSTNARTVGLDVSDLGEATLRASALASVTRRRDALTLDLPT